jgi:hypothetical protein
MRPRLLSGSCSLNIYGTRLLQVARRHTNPGNETSDGANPSSTEIARSSPVKRRLTRSDICKIRKLDLAYRLVRSIELNREKRGALCA